MDLFIIKVGCPFSSSKDDPHELYVILSINFALAKRLMDVLLNVFTNVVMVTHVTTKENILETIYALVRMAM
jgi:hypothetical protein